MSITIGSPIRVALAPTDINPDQSPANLAVVIFTTTTSDKRYIDSVVPSNKLPAMVVEGVELETHITIKETSGPDNSKFDRSKVLMTHSMVGVIDFLNERGKEYLNLLQKCKSQEKAFTDECLKLLRKYESVVADLNKERENTLAERRKVYMEIEKAIEEKEKLEKELSEVKLKSSTQLEELKEEKKNSEFKLKSLGLVASKKALFELRHFVLEKHPEFNFSGFIMDFNVLTPPKPDEDDNSSAPTNNVSNMEVDPSEIADEVIALEEEQSNIILTVAILISDLEVLRAENDELKSKTDPSSSNNSLKIQLLDAHNKCNTLNEKLQNLKSQLDLQVETTKDLLSEHEALAIENTELREALKEKTNIQTSCSKNRRWR
ncbi:hypothetical protein NE237_028638 [Protea cynaroides]|uniref:Uncharacterized protein n=1 Tax=Protea cynaroides TaxID=273540 RepID=A0A9Q0GRJ7_9MAGN|nr:hypothetical protein NE237_028638 [Protea cynaroides]